MKLSPKTIKALKPSDRRQEIKDDECRGLYLLVQPSGSKTWAVRYSLDGKLRKDDRLVPARGAGRPSQPGGGRATGCSRTMSCGASGWPATSGRSPSADTCRSCC
jgi:hypothetical protein